MLLQYAQNVLFYTLPFLVVISFVVTFHELGHFAVARWCGVAVDRFSIGFGRAVASWTDKSGVEWRIGWMPIGGYVRFAGDESAASVPDSEDLQDLRRQVLAREGPQGLKRYFHFKPLWQRTLVVAAGPAANFILSTLLFAALAMTVGDIMVKARVGGVEANSPAARAGFQAGDLITRANGRPIATFDEVTRLVALSTGEPIRFEVQRGGRPVDLVATPARSTATDKLHIDRLGLGYLGLMSSNKVKGDITIKRFAPLAALERGTGKTVDVVGSSLTYIRRMALGRENGQQLGGIVGMAGRTGQMTSESVKLSSDIGSAAENIALNLIQMAAFISAAVGFANLLPIPVLDGGHLLFYGYEAVARRPLTASVQAAGYRVGFALLIGLMLFVTWNDLQRYRVLHLLGSLLS